MQIMVMESITIISDIAAIVVAPKSTISMRKNHTIIFGNIRI